MNVIGWLIIGIVVVWGLKIIFAMRTLKKGIKNACEIQPDAEGPI